MSKQLQEEEEQKMANAKTPGADVNAGDATRQLTFSTLSANALAMIAKYHRPPCPFAYAPQHEETAPTTDAEAPSAEVQNVSTEKETTSGGRQ